MSRLLLSRRAQLVLGAVALVAAIAILIVVRIDDGQSRGSAGPVPSGPVPDLTDRVTGFLAAQRADQPYRDPTAAERADAAVAFAHVLSGSPGSFAAFGFSAVEDVDPDTGRRYALYASGSGDRAWGAVLVDLSAPIRRAIEVPHPRTDIDTEGVGLDLFRKVPGSVVLFAGAHRRAGAGAADVAHNAASFFHALAVTLAERGVPQVQVHGFADLNLPDADSVVSTGSDTPNPLATRIADDLDARGITACRAWGTACGRLEGTTNVQGHAAAEQGSVFVHVELSNRLRADAGRRATVVEALAAAV
jgi:hypothetical protein